MKIRIVGKMQRSGVSKKTGRNYSFVELHYIAPARGVTGDAALTTVIDTDLYPYDNIAPGLYNLEFDHKGRAVSLTPIQPAAKEVTKNG